MRLGSPYSPFLEEGGDEEGHAGTRQGGRQSCLVARGQFCSQKEVRVGSRPEGPGFPALVPHPELSRPQPWLQSKQLSAPPTSLRPGGVPTPPLALPPRPLAPPLLSPSPTAVGSPPGSAAPHTAQPPSAVCSQCAEDTPAYGPDHSRAHRESLGATTLHGRRGAPLCSGLSVCLGRTVLLAPSTGAWLGVGGFPPQAVTHPGVVPLPPQGPTRLLSPTSLATRHMAHLSNSLRSCFSRSRMATCSLPHSFSTSSGW